jgi:hypothetical protein
VEFQSGKEAEIIIEDFLEREQLRLSPSQNRKELKFLPCLVNNLRKHLGQLRVSNNAPLKLPLLGKSRFRLTISLLNKIIYISNPL